jgi:ABC-type uncharacterized transport system substrate-binding protein
LREERTLRFCPTGKSVARFIGLASSPFCKNISGFPNFKSELYDSHLVPLRGALRNVNDAELAARLPTMHSSRDNIDAGGMISRGPDITDRFRRAAEFVDKILRGAKPADLSVEQPTKFELVINLKAAKTLGLEISLTLLARADDVIE